MPSDGTDECVSVLHTHIYTVGWWVAGWVGCLVARWVGEWVASWRHFIFMLIDSTLTAYKLTVFRVPARSKEPKGVIGEHYNRDIASISFMVAPFPFAPPTRPSRSLLLWSLRQSSTTRIVGSFTLLSALPLTPPTPSPPLRFVLLFFRVCVCVCPYCLAYPFVVFAFSFSITNDTSASRSSFPLCVCFYVYLCVWVCVCPSMCVCGCQDNNKYRNLLLATHKPTKSTKMPQNSRRWT